MEKFRPNPQQPEHEFKNSNSYSEYWPMHEKIKCPYEDEGEMFIDMATYLFALEGVKHLLGDPIKLPPELLNHAVGLAEAFGFYDANTGTVSLSGADIHSLYPNEVERRGGLQ